MLTLSMPEIDISQLRHADTLAELDRACRDWGFFQITNHAIPQAMIDELFEQAHAFFDQTLEQKHRLMRTLDNPWGFYDRELTANKIDLKQVYDYGPSDGAGIRPQWPGTLPAFREAVQQYYWHCEQVAYRLLAAVSTNLGMSPGYLSRGFGRRHTSFLRLNHYPVTRPPTRSPADPPGSPGALPGAEGSLGVGQHTDAGALTLLLQDAQPGLEVFREGRWHLVQPRSDALVVNLGDIVQIWSNDEYRAGLHRVVASTRVPRYSVPFFLNPDYRTDYAPLPSMVSSHRPARFRPVNWGDFRRLRTEGDFADYGEEVQIDHYRIPA